MIIRIFRHLTALMLFATVGWVALADIDLAGTYSAAGTSADGKAYNGDVAVQAHGPTVALSWALDGGVGYRGLGLELDGVLGSVFWSELDEVRAPGIVVYRIDGGRLEGIWKPEGDHGPGLGREDLAGSPDLEGRYDITLGQNPDGRSRYTGHVMIERRGEIHYFHWFTPGESFVGSGIRIGTVMVVGYALGHAPGTAAYCIQGGELDGRFSYGADARLGRETLRRSAAGDGGAEVGTAPMRDCAAKVAMAGVWNR